MATTFRVLKQDSLQGYRIRDLVSGSVTTGGSTTYFADAARTEPAGEWDRVDTYVMFTSGTLDGVERRITGFSAGNSSFVFAPAAASSVGSGTTYTLRKSFNDSMLSQAVNAAFADAYPDRYVNSVATAFETEGTWSMNVPSAAFNAQTELVKVERSWGTAVGDRYIELWPGADYKITDYGASGVSAQIVFAHTGASGWLIRFTGRTANAALTSDAQTTDEPAHLVHLGARKFLAALEGDDKGVIKWSQEYDKAKSNYYRNRPAKRIKVPAIWVGGWDR